MPDVIYIMGDDRSGSTMLDMMLAGHSGVTSIGEAHHLKAYAERDHEHYKSVHNLVCLCGHTIESCEFWSKVQKRLVTPLSSLKLKLFFLRSDFQGKPLQKLFKKMSWLVLQVFPGLYNSKYVERLLGGEAAATDSFKLFDAVLSATGSRYIIDSSKSPFRMKSICNLDQGRVKVIALCRDPRGVVSSKMKRNVPLKKASYQWRWVVEQMELFCNGLQEEDICKVKYEDLCNEPDREMRRITQFLSLEYEPAILQRNHEGVHHLGGSPSKYENEGVPIKLDESYKNRLTDHQMAVIMKITHKQAKLWGYS